MADYAAQPNFRGCAFVRAGAESATGSSVKTACDDARQWLPRPDRRPRPRGRRTCATPTGSRANSLLHDGAAVSAQMEHGSGAALAARAAAALLLDAATAPAQPA